MRKHLLVSVSVALLTCSITIHIKKLWWMQQASISFCCLLFQCLWGDQTEGLHQLGHRSECRRPHRKPHEEHEPDPSCFHHGAGKSCLDTHFHTLETSAAALCRAVCSCYSSFLFSYRVCMESMRRCTWACPACWTAAAWPAWSKWPWQMMKWASCRPAPARSGTSRRTCRTSERAAGGDVGALSGLLSQTPGSFHTRPSSGHGFHV